MNRGKKKVLFLANHFTTLYAFRKEIIIELCKSGVEVYISIPKDEENFFRNLGCTVILTEVDRRGINPIRDIKLLLDYYKIINRVRPDIIFSFTIKPNIYGSLVSNGKVKQLCNITGTGGTFLQDNLISKICKVLYRYSVKNCYKVYFQNNGDKDFFVENKLVRNNYEVIPGSGCNLATHPYSVMPMGTDIKFLFIGRIMKIKGIEEYLQAAKVIKEKNPEIEFIIAGWNEEEQYQSLIEEYRQQGIVNYIGFKKDISEWIKSCHCVVLPSHGGEGVPNVLLESGALGRPCIGSRINGTMDVIEDGKTGYLFEPKNYMNLVEKMEQFINLSYEEKKCMGDRGRKRIEEKFSREIIVNKYLEEVFRI